MPERFSQRHETRRPATGLVDREIPNRARTDLSWIVGPYLDDVWYKGRFEDLWRQIYQVIGQYKPPPILRGGVLYKSLSGRSRGSVNSEILEEISGCSWDEFYDVIEVLADNLQPTNSDEFHNGVNEMLLRSYVAYELRDGKIERVGTRIEDEVIAKARGILRDQDLAGPNDQFIKAVGFFNRRPDPDVENCVKEAVGAVEGVARIFLDDPGILLSRAAKEIGKQYSVHRTLQKLFEDVYAYRGDAEGAGHGKTGAKPSITQEDAELVLYTSGALIVFMARLYGRDVQ